MKQKKYARSSSLSLSNLQPDLPYFPAPSATVGVVPTCQKDYPGFDQQIIDELLKSAELWAHLTERDEIKNTRAYRRALKASNAAHDTMYAALDLMLSDAFEKGKNAQSAKASLAGTK